MNENAMNKLDPSDEEILDGIRSRLAGVEPLVAAPPAWRASGSAAAAHVRSDRMLVRVQPRGAFGFGAALAILVVVVFAAASLGALGPRNPASSGASPGAFVPVTTITYVLVVPAGAQLTAAQLDTTVRIMTSRANSAHAMGLRVTAQPPDRVSVSVSGTTDVETLRSFLGQTGQLEFVYLPPDVYGTVGAPGVKAVPSTGDLIDPTLPAQFTGADIDPGSCGVSPDPSTPDRSVVDFAFRPAVATQFATWTGQHVNDYLAVVLDGVVQSAPPIVPYVDGGRGEITANYTASSAETLVALLRYGALPFPVKEVSVVVSTPGPESARPSTSTSLSIGHVPSGPTAIITYRLLPPGGGTPSAAELEQTVRMLAYRLASFFPTALVSSPAASGPQMPDLSRAEGFSVTALAPDHVVVRFQADIHVDNSSYLWDAAAIRKWLAHPGRLDFVDLPPGVYGTAGSPGPRPLPSAGTALDPTLAPLLTRADLASLGVSFSSAAGLPDVRVLRFDLTSAGAATMAHYADLNTGHYLALTLDGSVLATSEMTAGLGRVGSIAVTASSNEAMDVVSWLFEEGNSPLPVPLTEVSFSSSGPSGSAAPAGPAATPTPMIGPTPVLATPTATGTFIVYVVEQNDTLSSIAARYNVSVASLEAANPQLGPAGRS